MGILGIAVALRIWGIGFGLPHTLARPDEEAVFSIALRFFRRTLDPGFLDWPSLFMYAVAAGWVVYFNVGRLKGWFPLEISFVAAAPVYPAPLHLIARALSAASGVLTVWTVHRVGLLLFNRTAALIAALFLAVAALHARDSHFGVTDVAATWLLTLSFLFTVRFARTGARRDAVLSALWAGLAASTKYNAALVALPGLWAIARGSTGGVTAWSDRLRLLLVYCLVAFVAFVAGTPYALLDVRSLLVALAGVGAHLRGGHAAMAGYAWIVHLQSSLRYGLGVPLLAAGIGGLVLYCWQDRRAGTLFALFPIVYFAVIGAGQTAFARYIIPVVPFLCLSAAHATVEIARWLAHRSRRPAWAPAFAWSLAVLVAAPSAWSTVRTDRLLSRTDNRLIAARWIHEQFAHGATMYQSGSGYGQIQLQTADPLTAGRYRETRFDEAAGVFRSADGRETAPPELIVLTQCPLTYCDVPDAVRQVVARQYTLAKTFTALDASHPGLVYDRDDAFFVPLAGFDGVSRPGPSLTIHVRRDLAPAHRS
jgi:hypothetical protein